MRRREEGVAPNASELRIESTRVDIFGVVYSEWRMIADKKESTGL